MPGPDAGLNDRFATLALDCVHREYPNKISHVLQGDADAQAPRDLYPVFHGCYDWHSAVHGHWLLVRLLRTDPRAARWLAALQPLEAVVADRYRTWLPNLAYPIRIGTHNQSAFGFALALDWARTAGDADLEALLVARTLDFHAGDENCPLGYEPSGEDFLSPCLMEADLMRRVLPQAEFADWLTAFLPGIPEDGSGDWLAPGIVLDPSDGKLVHLDGVNLSRAWNLAAIAHALPEGDARIAALEAASAIHRETGLASVSGDHYEGGHWLASFATYLETGRALDAPTTEDNP